MNESVIALRHLSKSYGNVHAVQNLSLTIEAGTIFGFLGPNGAGKTTTMRMLCGLTHPTSGRATIEEVDTWKERQKVRTKFGYVPQSFSLYRDLTVLENFRFFAGAYNVPGALLEERIDRLLHGIDLEEKRGTTADNLSGGMRQLLAIGCALVHNPSVLFLDEPTRGLDPAQRKPAPLCAGSRAIDRQVARKLAVSRYSIVRREVDTTRHGRCFHRLFTRIRRRSEAIRFMRWLSFEATASVAYKEFLHIYRDR